MPVRKLTLAEAEESLWLSPSDPRHWRRVDALLRLAGRLTPRAPVRGVQKFRSIEDAQTARERQAVPAT